jgi:ABC-type multidrug transport system fused ATPase/permease subunit
MNFTLTRAMPKELPARAKPQQRDTLRYVFGLLNRFLAGQHRVFLLALVMLIAETVTSIFESYPLAYLIDYLREDRPDLLTYFGLPVVVSPLIATVAALTSAIIVMAMLNSLGDSLAEIYLAQGGRALGYNLRLALFTHLQRLSLAFHDQRRTGDTLTRITGDVSEIEDFVIGSLSDIIGSLLVLIGTMASWFITPGRSRWWRW